ncbi:hypothetical protein CMMCAS08_11085 [Clavibacter michiganensis subsp. michiganensis]|nr:hypothetical protein CMMCAS05_11340 [Clavibacter michiganensis subsp. michiganensis]OUE03288.1 hypothetical protein CMMCAS08_11085 [Clavibacter michiganensis subsp. michiganensis]OUE11555.1 hypothetical protein CMMCAY01_00995 [Clavibacter michiganensis subsp. michiganensis]
MSRPHTFGRLVIVRSANVGVGQLSVASSTGGDNE